MCTQPLSEKLTLQLTKLQLPRITHPVIHRKQLLGQLTSSKQHVLIVAPAGYGKTTIVTQWLNTSYARQQIAWFSIDTTDNNTSMFLNYLIAALEQDHIDHVEARLQAYWELFNHPQTILSVVINDLMQSDDVEKVLVLDDYHLINDNNADIHKLVQQLLNTAIPQLKLVILSRTAPPYSIAKIRAENRLRELRFEDLLFTREEVHKYFYARLNLTLSDTQLDALNQFTEGWGVGLAMVALRMMNTNDIDAFIQQCAGTEKSIADYLLSEIFDQQSEKVQQFLVQTSLLNHFQGDLCDAVLERHDSYALLTRLENMGLLVIPLDTQRRWYRYHHFFRDFLRERLAQADDTWLQLMHRRASHWFAENANNNPESISAALYHAQKADQHLLLNTLQRFGTWLLKHGHQQLIIDYLTPFSIKKLGEYPTLLTHYLWALLGAGEMAHLRRVIDTSLSFIPRHMQGNALAIRAEIEPDWHQRRDFCLEALTLLDDDDLIARCMAQGNLARIAFFADGKTEHAIQILTRMVALYEQVQVMKLWAFTLDCLIAVRRHHGTLLEAEALCHHAIEVCEQHNYISLSCAFYSQLGKILYEQNRLPEAIDILAHCRQICDKHININSYVAASLTLARCVPDEEAEIIRTETRHYVKTSGYQRRRVEVATDYHFINDGWIAPLIDWQKTTFDNKDEPISLLALYTNLILTRRFVNGDKASVRHALPVLKQLQTLCQQADRKSDLIECLVLTTVAYERLNERRTAIHTLEKALRLAKHTGHIRLFLDAGKVIITLLEHIAQHKHGHTDVHVLFNSTPIIAPCIQLQESLTRRETEILGLVGEGLTNIEISHSLSISLNTTRWHLKNIFRKLHVDNRTKASAYARTLGILK